MAPSNYHTHTCYCDGADTPEELILEAIRLGCPAIGFTGHSYTPFDLSYCMTLENTERYNEEIPRLKEKYKGKINVLFGIEQDFTRYCLLQNNRPYKLIPPSNDIHGYE